MKNEKLQRLEEKFSLAQTLVEDLSELVDDFSTDDLLPAPYETGGELVEYKPTNLF